MCFVHLEPQFPLSVDAPFSVCLLATVRARVLLLIRVHCQVSLPLFPSSFVPVVSPCAHVSDVWSVAEILSCLSLASDSSPSHETPCPNTSSSLPFKASWNSSSCPLKLCHLFFDARSHFSVLYRCCGVGGLGQFSRGRPSLLCSSFLCPQVFVRGSVKSLDVTLSV